jgi:hypothetical protein
LKKNKGDNTDITVKDIVVEQTRAQIACMLNELWHSKLPDIHWSNVVRNKHYICYAFKYKQAIIGVGIWSSPVAANRFKDGDKLLELRRLALSDVCPRNTASFVIATMIKDIKERFPELIRLISYQDTEAHLGTIYKASNWTQAPQQTPLLDWTTSKRKRTPLQSTAAKIRWEYEL